MLIRQECHYTPDAHMCRQSSGLKLHSSSSKHVHVMISTFTIRTPNPNNCMRGKVIINRDCGVNSTELRLSVGMPSYIPAVGSSENTGTSQVANRNRTRCLQANTIHGFTVTVVYAFI